MQMVEQPWGVAAYGAASVKASPDLARIDWSPGHVVVSAAVILGFSITH